MECLRGTGVALITPFTKNNELDERGLKNVVNHTVECGADFLVVLGTTAETPTLSAKEKERIKELIIEENNGRLPLVLGVGGNNTFAVQQEISQGDFTHFDAILSVSPYYNKPTQQGIYEHFQFIAEHVDKKIIIYNVPGRTGSNIESRTTLRLAQDFENIVGIKEASGNFLQGLEIIAEKPDDFLVLSGDDELAVSTTLAGGDGVISVIGQVVPEYSRMINLALNKKTTAAYEIFYSIQNLIKAIYLEGNPAGIKALLEIKGICSRYTRLPIIAASSQLVEKIKVSEMNKNFKNRL